MTTSAQDLTNVLLDGRYRLTRLMGEGGMGQVYEGIHATLDRKVAVKVLLPRYAYEPKFRERFLREAKAASKVRHPNVVQILDFGDTPSGSVYFVMELLEGRDLAALLRQEGRLPWPRARHILLQAASALAAAHERKIIHRDIKPANFFIGQARGVQDLVKVLDFGIAKLAADANHEESSLAQSLTGTGEVFGTAKYMAPEQAYGASDDPRVDVYSLGIVAYELLTGTVPFTGVSVFEIITRHVNERPRPLRELVPELPAEVEAWVLQALAKLPEDRFASMDAMEQALLAIPGGVPVEPTVVQSWPPPSPGAQPGPVGAVITAPAPTHPVGAVPAPGSATSVIPTRLKAPSPVTSGELVAPGPTLGPGVGRGSEESGIGASTARLQGVGDEGSSTGPTHARASGSRAAETDPHPLYTASRPVVAASRPSLVLGLLGMLGGGAAVLAGYLVVAASEDPPSSPAAVVDAGQPEATEPGPASASGSQSVPLEAKPVEPTPTPVTSAPTPVASAPTPVEPAPTPAVRPTTAPAASTARKPTNKPAKPAAPPSDDKVVSQLAAALKKRCSAHGSGVTATVTLAVGSDGSLLDEAVSKVSPELEKCLIAGVAKARFSPGKTRRLTVKVSL